MFSIDKFDKAREEFNNFFVQYKPKVAKNEGFDDNGYILYDISIGEFKVPENFRIKSVIEDGVVSRHDSGEVKTCVVDRKDNYLYCDPRPFLSEDFKYPLNNLFHYCSVGGRGTDLSLDIQLPGQSSSKNYSSLDVADVINQMVRVSGSYSVDTSMLFGYAYEFYLIILNESFQEW